MNSFNHYAFGSVGEWIYAHVAGIDLDPGVPGYRHIQMRPQPVRELTEASASFLSPDGMIVSQWNVIGDKFLCSLEIPANTTATVTLPSLPSDSILESGRPANTLFESVDNNLNLAFYHLGSGCYYFEMPFILN